MDRAEIKRIGDYLRDLEVGLIGWEYDNVAMQVDLQELYRVIKNLMDATFETKDQRLKPLLASLELKARKCKQLIEQRLPVRN